jgi:uncharacterized membrane protein
MFLIKSTLLFLLIIEHIYVVLVNRIHNRKDEKSMVFQYQQNFELKMCVFV